MLLILDSSAIISVLVSDRKSYTRDILKLIDEKKVKLISTEEIFDELKSTTKSRKIKNLTKYKPAKMGSFIAWYKYNVQLISLPAGQSASLASRDSTDNVYLILAEKEKVDFLITLDKDLLVLEEIKKCSV
ncbi:MAG: putative toxin-antitoxin system toxin component, PIN family [Candidatus Levybacteria bacterium]|nr:putative toxin-antitoxin system toxin component, PIN family [Candidatus Levybacteria bacterium]